MKHDIFFDEFTPLSFKPEQENSVKNLQVVALFEILLVTCGCGILPQLGDTCEQVPLAFWVFVMVALVNFHLIVVALEFFLGKGRVGMVANWCCVGLVAGWLAYGNFLIFYEGIECMDQQGFIASALFLVSLDILYTTLTIYYSHSILTPKSI